MPLDWLATMWIQQIAKTERGGNGVASAYTPGHIRGLQHLSMNLCLLLDALQCRLPGG